VTSYILQPKSDTVVEVRPTAKINQSHLVLAFLLRQAEGEHILVLVPVAVPLQITDRGKTECNYTAWDQAVFIPGWDVLVSLAEQTYDWWSMDRDVTNIRGASAWELSHFEEKGVFHRGGCYSHNAFIVNGHLFKTVPFLVSGLIAVDLSTRNGSMWRLFFLCLVEVLLASVTVLETVAPGLSGAVQEYRDACLRTLLPGTGIAAQRRALLQKNLPSDWESESIYLYILGGMAMQELSAWAHGAADALLHCRVGSIRRQRWMTANAPVARVGLLCAAHNLFERTAWLFARRAQGKAAMAPKPATEGLPAITYIADDTAGMPNKTIPEPEAPPPIGPGGEVDWSAWNRTQQRSVERFRLTQPSGPICIISLVADMVASLQR